jgi:Metallo-peptidase family M12/Secretion system C-terminal sorting domain
MKFIFKTLLLFAILSSQFVFASNAIWLPLNSAQVETTLAADFNVTSSSSWSFDLNQMTNILHTAGDQPNAAITIELPYPDGSFHSYKIWESSIMESGLASKFPQIKTYSGYDISNPAAVLKLDINPINFHAMVFDGVRTFMINPRNRNNASVYASFFKKDLIRTYQQQMHCEVGQTNMGLVTNGSPINVGSGLPALNTTAQRTNGTVHKKYRLALACTYEYACAVTGSTTPTQAPVLAAMVTSVNRVNGVYENEFGVTLTLINNTNLLIYLTSADPYTNNNGSTMLGQNQNTVTTTIGSANYDIGHVFSTGGGGIASLGCVCGSVKAQGVTGSPSPVGDAYDIDYVAHEMGHQFGCNHTFNSNNGSCSGNRNNTTAYEPLSGTTIMAYAGICSPDDIQQHSDPYFHAASLVEASKFITTGSGTCYTTVATPNNPTPSTVPSILATYNIPFKTPFELTAPIATDPDHQAMTYCWEAWNLGNFGTAWTTAYTTGPNFRSFNPDTSRTRVFPMPSRVVRNTASPNYLGEKLPEVARKITAKLTVRDINNGIGCFNFTDDSVNINAINTTNAFTVLTPATTATTWLGGTNQTVTWNVVGTTAAPINCNFVNIYLSVDSGYTFPYVLASHVANSGTATFSVPNINTTNKARVKVKGDSNIFFNLNPSVFTIQKNTTLTAPNLIAEGDSLTICSGKTTTLHYAGPTGYTKNWFNGSTADSVIFVPATTGFYTVSANNGVNYYIDTIYITVNPSPSATVSPTGTTLFCAPSSLLLTATTNATGVTYLWYNNNNPITTATSSTYTATSAGNYTVKITSTDGCATISSASVLLSGTLTASITATGSTSICAGGSVLLSANTGNNYTYQWYQNGVAIAGATNSTYVATASGNYSVAIVVGTCNAASNIIAVSVNTASNAPIVNVTASGSTTICTGASLVLTTNTGINYSYQWQLNGVAISGATQNSYTVTSGGSYTVLVTNGGCNTTSSAVIVTQLADVAPIAKITPASSTDFCAGNNVALLANTGANYFYEWYYNNNLIAGASSSIYNASLPGAYKVKITSNVCTGTSLITTLTQHPLPVPTIAYASGLLSITNPGFNSYQWYLNGQMVSGAYGISYYPVQNGVYTMQVTDQWNCTGVSNGILIENFTGVANTNLNNQIIISPNPAHDQIQIMGINNPMVKIYNALGQEVIKVANQALVSIAALSNGIYMVHVFDEHNNLVHAQKLIKE